MDDYVSGVCIKILRRKIHILCTMYVCMRPLGRPRRRWEYNIKMDLQEVGGGRGDWMELAQDTDSWRALVGTVRDFRVP